MCSLTDPANQVLWEFDAATVKTWTDLVERLRSRYGSADQTALYQTQLGTRRQKDNEDLGALVRDVRRLMTLAYPGCASELSEVIAIRAFLDALRNKTLALKIREREPRTLDAAFKIAMRLECYQKADESQPEEPERRYGRSKAVKEAELSNESIRRLLQEEMEPQRRRLEQLERSLTSLQAHPMQWTPPRTSTMPER